MAARKRVDPLKAKAAKQKKIAIGGVVVLCLVLFIQGPKTLKMIKGADPTPVAAVAPVVPTEPVPGAPAAAPVAGDPTTAVAIDLALVADSDAPPVAGVGQLVTFERFASKDPFVPQAVAEPAASGGTPTPAGAPDAAVPASPSVPASPQDGSGPVDGGFTPAPAPGSTGGAAPAAPALATLTSISVNGTAEDVEVKKPFPATQPTFVLVSLAKNGKSVEIGIAGGTYADGGQTIELKLGRSLTLQNTADGTRYELELLAVAGFAIPKS